MDFYDKWSVIFINRLMKDFNLDLLGAVAIVGNAGHESAGFKKLQEVKPLVPGSRGGWGIMQWTGPRRREAEAYWERNNLDPSDMDANYKFLFVELSGPEGGVLPRVKSAKTLEEKTKIFSEMFLRPGIPHMDSRVIWSKRALDAWGKQVQKSTQKPIEPLSKSVGTSLLSSLWTILLMLLRGKE